MKRFVTLFSPRAVILSFALLGAVSVGHAGPDMKVSAKAKPPEAKSASTNVVVIPNSVFAWPPTQKDGRDPFFPDSTRIYANSAVNTNAVPTAVILKLDGIGGTRERPLVMINGHTFGPDETAQIATTSGRIKVHVLEITTNSAVVEVNGVSRELRLKEEKFHMDAEGLKGSGK
jgi:hypothetical protein